MANPSSNVQENWSNTFWDILATDRQTNRDENNLLVEVMTQQMMQWRSPQLLFIEPKLTQTNRNWPSRDFLLVGIQEWFIKSDKHVLRYSICMISCIATKYYIVFRTAWTHAERKSCYLRLTSASTLLCNCFISTKALIKVLKQASSIK